MREGVTFHDGSTLDAEDVVATYRALLDPVYAASIRSDYVTLDSVEALDDGAVRFNLTQPDAAFAHRLTLGVVPAEAVADPAPLEESTFGAEPVGTGPYRLAEWRRGESMRLEANPEYWDGAPAVPQITIVFAVDDNTRAQRMRAGEFDGTVLPPALAQTFQDSEYTVHHHPSADYRTVTLPTANPVTGDAAVRRALNHAVDRRGMIGALLAGQGSPASNPIPEVLDEYSEPAAQFEFDRTEAERILDEGGWVLGPDGVRVRDGVPARFTLMYPRPPTPSAGTWRRASPPTPVRSPALPPGRRPRCSTATRTSCPAAPRSGSGWRRRWRATRRCCSPTSRRRAWTARSSTARSTCSPRRSRPARRNVPGRCC